MKGITISDGDERNVLAFDLKDILVVAGHRALQSIWTISDVDVAGEKAATELHRICDEHETVNGSTLLNLSQQVWQVIDGRFEATDITGGSPWLAIYAVDSSAFDVVTDDMQLLERLRSSFREVADLPDEVL